MQIQGISRDIEVNGETLGAFVDAFRQYPSVVTKYLVKYEFLAPSNTNAGDIDRAKWYPLDTWLSAFNAIAKEVGSNSLYAIGKKVPENVVFPPDQISDIHAALRSIDVAYHLNHRKKGVVMFNLQTGEMVEGIGHMVYRPMNDDRMAILECDDPYPCEFDRGVISTMAAKFEQGAKAFHDNEKPCRKKGGASCTYVVQW